MSASRETGDGGEGLYHPFLVLFIRTTHALMAHSSLINLRQGTTLMQNADLCYRQRGTSFIHTLYATTTDESMYSAAMRKHHSAVIHQESQLKVNQKI